MIDRARLGVAPQAIGPNSALDPLRTLRRGALQTTTSQTEMPVLAGSQPFLDPDKPDAARYRNGSRHVDQGTRVSVPLPRKHGHYMSSKSEARRKES